MNFNVRADVKRIFPWLATIANVPSTALIFIFIFILSLEHGL